MNRHVGQTSIFSIFSREDFEKMIANGYVTVRRHPTLPLSIANYTPSAQYEKRWNDVTEWCRGLIFDDDYNIMARSWKKFYNLGEVNLPIQFTDPVEVMDKVDGSLGILYPLKSELYSGHHDFAISTRGSFTSEQAQEGSRIWRTMYDGLNPMTGYTMLFEIVYPQNRIVLNYGDTRDLILLGAVENENGNYISPTVARSMWFKYVDGKLEYTEWTGPVVKTFDDKNISEALGHMDRENAEGYVIRSHNFMVKLKQPDYLELHRLVTNMTPKTIWEQLRGGKSVSQIVAGLPDEFHSMAEGIAGPLNDRFNERLAEIVTLYMNVKYNVEMYAASRNLDTVPTRKQYAESFKQYKDGKYFFSLLDNRPISDLLWTELKPKEIVTAQED